MKVNFLNLKPKKNIKKYISITKKILLSGQYILGNNVEQFEKRFSKYVGSKYAIGVNSGTDALMLSIKYLNLNKEAEVLTVPNSYFTTTSSILLNNLKLKFVDVGNDYNICTKDLIKKITKKTKLLVLPHLGGRVCKMKEINEILKKNNIHLIEDCAQAIGSKYKGVHVGNFGYAGCYSLHPLKNLSAFGDGGIISTNNKKFYNWLKIMRNNGHLNRDKIVKISSNSRLDELQAGYLLFKLKNINKLLSARSKNAEFYFKNINNKKINFLERLNGAKESFHLFVLRTSYRSKFIKYLKERGIETKIHYPISINNQKIYKNLKGSVPKNNLITKEIVSIPINETLTKKELKYVVQVINEF